jgi:hypothetical protein
VKAPCATRIRPAENRESAGNALFGPISANLTVNLALAPSYGYIYGSPNMRRYEPVLQARGEVGQEHGNTSPETFCVCYS